MRLYTLCDESMSVLHLYVLLVSNPALTLIIAGLKLIFKGSRYHATKEPAWN